MPRLSLYRPEKSKDFKFFDRTIYEMFQVGGVDVYVHKYIGPLDPSDPNKALGETTIQDVLFLENRDRKYDTNIFTIRGHYQTQDIDFNLSQFGLFLQNDTVFMTVHINNSVDLIGRKIMSGDVFELPNLREEYFLESEKTYIRAIKKFYVVEEINRAAEGFSATWYPHLYRIKLKPLIDSQEFKDILDRPEDEDVFAGDWDEDTVYYPGQVVKYAGTLYQVKTDGTVPNSGTNLEPPNADSWEKYQSNTLRDTLSTYNRELEINSAIIAEAENDAPLSGYETGHFFTLAVDPLTGKTAVRTSDDQTSLSTSQDISQIMQEPIRDGYSGYLLGDGVPPNGSAFGYGITFPYAAIKGDYFLRTDYLPNRLFKFDGVRWVKQEDNVRMTLGRTKLDPITGKPIIDLNDFDVVRQTQKTSFINNKDLSGIGRITGDVIKLINGIPSFDDSTSTTDFFLDGGLAVIITSVNYTTEARVEVWLDESSKATNIEYFNENNKLKFKIKDPLTANSSIRYTVYESSVEQRQSVSKALRKIKPVADE